MEPHYHIDHQREGFNVIVRPAPVRYDIVSDQQQAEDLPSAPPEEVLLTIRYRKTMTYWHRTRELGEMTILEKNEDKKETTLSHLFLIDLKCVHLSSRLLSSELSNLGIPPWRHEGVIERISRYAHQVGVKIQVEKNGRAVVLVPVVVDVLWDTFKWICLKCKKERERKEMLKGCRVNNFKDCANCAICLEEFGVGTKLFVVKTPCSHEFHEECLLAWLLKTPSCPLCRFDMSILID
ncbi:hypothetical protein TIFTF001_011036 [Ficus carica]|uniref:RING-type domain-containing protein n=1 Tax=Ficus carica TaxID=3494 RepID=A0AA87ZXI6_FICCA|nr:hypothetical protein TIFTF001_011036 [Ficus carica]